MVSAKQLEGGYSFVKANSGNEPLKCHIVPTKGMCYDSYLRVCMFFFLDYFFACKLCHQCNNVEQS